ncbi:hypothetical protein AB0B57_23700 [Micromonospora sp. NPDC049101]|uniref:hypothetical protein n=1 Tax=Micromonospora sp. NPDC049101 TaxID=3155032 RepID=UPI0033CA3268
MLYRLCLSLDPPIYGAGPVDAKLPLISAGGAQGGVGGSDIFWGRRTPAATVSGPGTMIILVASH